MVPAHAAGGITQSSSGSGLFFQGNGQSQIGGASQLNSNFGNSLHSLTGHARANMSSHSGDVRNVVLNSAVSSAPSVGASSLVTDANSGLSGGGPHLQRNTSFNTDSYMRLPTSPRSFTSNNISISGSSVMNGSSIVQQSSNQDRGFQAQQSQQNQGASSATSLPTSRIGQVQLPGGPRGPNPFMQDPTSISQLQKKPRLDIKQEDILQQQVIQQLLQRHDPMQLQSPNPQLQALIQQQRIRQQQQQQQQLLQSMPPMQLVQLLQQQQQQQQLRQQLMQQGMQPALGMKRPYDGGVCSRRLMQYLYHQRQRPAENTLAYWRKFVAEYYSPRAKKRWCLSLYDNVGHHSLGVFPQAAVDAWQCDICGSKSGRGFEATFEVLPRLNEIKFGSGVIDDLLFLDLARESRFPSGMMVLEYAKAVQESVYEQIRVVREGQLRIIFTPELKILSWEFCARRHEELVPRRLVAPQVNQLLQVAQKCQSTISESGSDGVSQPDIQANSAMVVTAGRQLARCLELPSLNDLGFSKVYVRTLQITEVVNSMRELMDFTTEQKDGPIDCLKNFPHRTGAPKAQTQEMDRVNNLNGPHGLPSDQNVLNKLMAFGLNSPMNNNQHMVGRAQAALALTNYQNSLMRQNSMNSTHNNSLQQAASPTTGASGPMGILPGPSQNSPASGFTNGQALNQQSPNENSALLRQNQSLPSQCSPTLQQQMIQQLLQEDMRYKNNGTATRQHMLNQGGNMSRDGLGIRSSPAVSGNEQHPSRSNSFKATSNDASPAPVGNMGGFRPKTSDLHLPDEFVADVAHEFAENGFF